METFEFRDTANRTWVVPDINLDHLNVLNEKGIDLDEMIVDGHFWSDTGPAKVACGVVLWTLCEGQHNIEERDFFKAFNGEVFDTAQEALARRVANFSPKRSKQIHAWSTTQADLQRKSLDVAEQSMELTKRAIASDSMAVAVVAQLERMLEGKNLDNELKAIAEALSGNVTSEPAKPELPTLANTA
jgi:hypothetical protein